MTDTKDIPSVPHHERWAQQRCVDHNFWNKASEAGLLCISLPEEYGGGGAPSLTKRSSLTSRPGSLATRLPTASTARSSRTISTSMAPTHSDAAGFLGSPAVSWSARSPWPNPAPEATFRTSRRQRDSSGASTSSMAPGRSSAMARTAICSSSLPGPATNPARAVCPLSSPKPKGSKASNVDGSWRRSA